MNEIYESQFIVANEGFISWEEIDRLVMPDFNWVVNRIIRKRKEEQGGAGTKPLESLVKNFELIRRTKASVGERKEKTQRQRIEERRRKAVEQRMPRKD